MRNAVFFLLFASLTLPRVARAQSGEPLVSVTISHDTIAPGEVLEVTYKIENTKVKRFDTPDFGEGVDLVGGPSTSTSIVMTGGVTQQSTSYTYMIRTEDTGLHSLPKVRVETTAGTLTADQLVFRVVEGHENETSRSRRNDDNMHSFFWNMDPFQNQQAAPQKKMSKKKYVGETTRL